MAIAVRAATLIRLLTLLGGVHVAQGLFMLVAPGTFFDLAGPFGAENPHYVRDLATYVLAFGLLLLAAARLPGWRPAALAFGVVSNLLHAGNHLLDIGEADPEIVGPLDFVGILALAILFLVMLRGAPPPGRERPGERDPI